MTGSWKLIGSSLLTLGAVGFGCAGPRAVFVTPRTPALEIAPHFPEEFSYELLSRTEAQACAYPVELEKMRQILGPPKSTEEQAVGNSVLFEEAKFQAIEKVPNADNLMFVRARAEIKEDERQCITVVGRAYRVKMKNEAPTPPPPPLPPPVSAPTPVAPSAPPTPTP